jgi:hypothetical protein
MVEMAAAGILLNLIVNAVGVSVEIAVVVVVLKIPEIEIVINPVLHEKVLRRGTVGTSEMTERRKKKPPLLRQLVEEQEKRNLVVAKMVVMALLMAVMEKAGVGKGKKGWMIKSNNVAGTGVVAKKEPLLLLLVMHNLIKIVQHDHVFVVA